MTTPGVRMRRVRADHLSTIGFQLPSHDIEYIWDAALGRAPVVQFGNTRPRPDPAFPFQLLHENLPPDDLINTPTDYLVSFGGRRPDVRPFELLHMLNASAMSLGGINAKLVEAIGRGQSGLGLVNTGEGGPAAHVATGANVVLQLGTAKFGLGVPVTVNGQRFVRLDHERLRSLVEAHDNVRMIEIKLSQGAKPGAVSLPAVRVSPVVALARGVPTGHDAVSPHQHAELLAATRPEKYDRLAAWIDEVRRITRVPVGIKLCVGRPDELEALVDCFARTERVPDFITVDSAYGGTASANASTANYVGYGDTYESVGLLDGVLRSAGLRPEIVVCASGLLHSPAHAVSAFAHGADAVFVARGFLYAAAAVNGVPLLRGVSPWAMTQHGPRTLSTIDVERTASGVRHYSCRFDQDVRLLTRLLGQRSPVALDRSCLRRHDVPERHHNVS